MTPDPHVAFLLALVSGVGYLMTQAGLSKHALELKRQRRVCPSCGRQQTTCRCHATG